MKPDWNSNVQPRLVKFAAHLPWLCPACAKVTNPGYRNQCQLCGARRP